MQQHLPCITKRQPLPSYCSRTGWKTAPMLFMTTRMFVLFLEISQRRACATCHSFTSKAKYHPCQKQQGLQGLHAARSNIRHYTYLRSNLQQRCHGATYYEQPILVRENKTRPITGGNLEFQKRRHRIFYWFANWKDTAKNGRNMQAPQD